MIGSLIELPPLRWPTGALPCSSVIVVVAVCVDGGRRLVIEEDGSLAKLVVSIE